MALLVAPVRVLASHERQRSNGDQSLSHSPHLSWPTTGCRSAFSRGHFKVLVRDPGRMVVFNQESCSCHRENRENSMRADATGEVGYPPVGGGRVTDPVDRGPLLQKPPPTPSLSPGTAAGARHTAQIQKQSQRRASRIELLSDAGASASCLGITASPPPSAGVKVDVSGKFSTGPAPCLWVKVS
jgi:hypothetical protein